MSVLRGEVDIYNQYIHGDVYWYRLEKFLGGTVAGEEDVYKRQAFRTADHAWPAVFLCLYIGILCWTPWMNVIFV